MPDNQEKTLAEEAGLPENWIPVDVAPIIPANPPLPPGASKYQVASLPPGFQHDVSFVKSGEGSPDIPKLSLMPLGVQGNPASNAAIQSTAAKTAAASTSAEIELQVPSIFTPTDQTVALPGPLVLDLASELQNTVFAGPASGSYAGGYVPSVDVDFALGYTLSLSNTTASANATAFLFTCFQLGTGGSVGATGLTTTGGLSYFGGKSFGTYSEQTAQTTVGASFSSTLTYTGFTGSNESCAGALVTLGGLVNIIIHGGFYQDQTGDTAVGFGSYTTIFSNPPFAAPVTAGNGIILALYGVGAGPTCYVAGTFSATDTSGNVWYQIADSGDPGWGAVNATRVVVLYAPNCAAGNPVISLTSTHDAWSCYYRLFEVSAASYVPVSSVPTFRALVDADLPIVDIPHGGTGLAVLPAHNVLLGEGVAAVAGAAPNTSGYYLKDNGPGVDPSFAALPASFYQTVEQATVAKTQRPILNFIAPITATDDAGNTSTDIAVSVFVGSGASHATGLVPDPGASAGTTKFLCEDATWQTVSTSGFNQSVLVDAVAMSDDYWLAVDTNAPDWILPLAST
jgi:hypothetical protein